MTNVKLYDRNFNEIELPGVKWLEFTPLPQTARRKTEESGNGEIVISQSKGPRRINARFKSDSSGFIYYKLMRDEHFDLLDPTKFMWAVDFSVSGKMWGIYVDGHSIDRINGSVAEVTLELYSPGSYAISRGTTMDDFTYDSELWGYGMGLKYDAATQDYIHNTSSFMIYNAGNQEVDPRESELVITLTSSTATAAGFIIRNNTTNETWKYNGNLNAGDQIIIDGVQMEKNAMNIVGDTDLDVISLAPGENQIQITGITGAFEISFEFRFLYA